MNKTKQRKTIIPNNSELVIPEGGWKFEKFDSDEYQRVRMIANETKQYSIMCSFLNARRQYEAAVERQNNRCKEQETEKLKDEEVETNPPSPIKETYQRIGDSKRETFPKKRKAQLEEKEEQKREDNRQKDKLITKGKNQKDNIKRWKQEKARLRKSLSAYHPESESIKIKFESKKEVNEITKKSIASLYQVNRYADLTEKTYVQEPGEDPFFLEAYKIIFHFVKVDLIYPPQEVNLAKMKTFVVRRVLDDYVIFCNHELSSLDKEHLNQIKRRMTKKDRDYYAKAGLSIPKSRIEKDYLLSIFKNHHFREFFRKYVEASKLIEYLKNINVDQIRELQQEIFRIQMLELPQEKKIEALRKITKRPIVNANIEQYQNEAKMVMLQYGQEKP